MMSVEAPETCWAAHKRQVINSWKCFIWLFDLFELYDEARNCQRQNINLFVSKPTPRSSLLLFVLW
jgi:hypothetical protein